MSEVPESAWQRIAQRFRVGLNGAALFDGAWKGTESAETGFAIELAPGPYDVDAIPRFERGKVIARYVRLTPTL